MQHDLIDEQVLSVWREWLFGRVWEGGCVCPMCDQHAKVYWRSVTSPAAANLVKLYHTYGNTAFHIKHLPIKDTGGEFARMRHWGLIQESGDAQSSKKHSGVWRLTDLGLKFAAGRATIPKYIAFYNGQVCKYEGPDIGILDALGNKFNYEELMSK